MWKYKNYPKIVAVNGVKPIFSGEVKKEVRCAIINTNISWWSNPGVTVTMKAGGTAGINIKVTDSTGTKMIYQKHFPYSSLYLFPDGCVEVRRDNLIEASPIQMGEDKYWTIKIIEKLKELYE